MEMYKQASIIALRFNTSKGSLSVEQLWQLSQTEKATCLKNLKKLLKKTDDDELSFLDNNIVVDATEQLRFDILKDIYLTQKEINENQAKAKEAKEHNEKIYAEMARRKETKITTVSDQELEAMIIK
jgi:uncharacterized cupredoxin-like copper-binding protein